MLLLFVFTLSSLNSVNDAFEINDFLNASKLGDVETVRNMLLQTNNSIINEAGGDLNVTALHLAASEGHFNLTSFLLDNGADVNAVNKLRFSPLMMAVANNGTVRIIETLLERGADWYIFSSDKGRNALFLAALNGKADIVKLLLDEGMDLEDGRDADDFSPLMAAADHATSSEAVATIEVSVHSNF